MKHSKSKATPAEIEERILGGTTARRGEVVITRGDGCWVFDEDDNKYLDLGSAQGVAMLGHCHPGVTAAIQEQAQTLTLCPSYLYNDIYGYKSLEEAILKDASSLYSSATDPRKPTYQVRYGTSPQGPFTQTSPILGGYVQVTVFWTFRSVTRFPGIPGQVNLARTVVMEVAPDLPSFTTASY